MIKLTIALSLALLWMLPAPAYCCLNGVLLSGKAAERAVKRAEALLQAGKYQRVLDWYSENEVRGQSLQRRAELIVLTAQVRIEARKRVQAREGVRDLIDQLKQLRGNNDDPLVKARLAEALVLLPGHQNEARTLIEELIRTDLMPDAEAWATGAYARRVAGDQGRAEAALARCWQIAGSRKHACSLPQA